MLGRSVNLKEMFSILDLNGDGKISYHEFMTGAYDKATLVNEETLRMAFNVLDRDGDGFLSIEEIKWRFSYFNKDGLVSEL